jgi:hypothetical protein
MFFWIDFASRTSGFFATCNQALFRIVGDISSQYWEDTSDFRISTGHFSTMLPSFNEGLQYLGHAVVE